MELINRYIYAVTQRLPEKQRPEIRRELQGLIEDMLEERAPAGQATKEDAENVLLELGPPSALADKYRGYERYLIGPGLFDLYVLTLKIVLISILTVLTGLFIVETFISSVEILGHFGEYIVALITGSAQGFGWVTLVFAILERAFRRDVSALVGTNKEWTPADLPAIPDTDRQIKRSEPIVAIFFTVLFTVLCLYANEVFGIWSSSDGGRDFIPFLNDDVFRGYWPLVWIVAGLGVLKECVRIYVRRRSGKLLAFHVAITVVSTLVATIVLADAAIWNPQFVPQLEAAGLVTAGGEGYATAVTIWGKVADWSILIVWAFALLDFIVEGYKLYRAKTAV